MRRVHARAAIVSIGDELMLGQTLDTNGQWISAQLVKLGIQPVERVTVPDDLEAQRHAFVRLSDSADLIICTGGLGPTADDLTRQALAAALQTDLVEDDLAVAEIEAFYAARNREMPAINRVQALRPRTGMSLPNLCGTAPGLMATFPSQCDVFCLPGPPSELKSMFEHQVVARLRPRPGITIATRALHCFGIGESDLATRLGDLMSRDRNPLVGTTASGGVVSCRIRYEGSDPETHVAGIMTRTEREIRAVAGDYIFGADSETLAEVVVHQLKSKGLTLGLVESCTGGGLAKAITDIPGSSRVFSAGLVTYSNQMKVELAGVPDANFAAGGPGAVSPETARDLALHARERLKADLCLSITGIAGPSGAVAAFDGRPAKPVGLVFVGLASSPKAIADLGLEEVSVRAFQHQGDRTLIREWSIRTTLAMLWQALNGRANVRLLREIEWPNVPQRVS